MRLTVALSAIAILTGTAAAEPVQTPLLRWILAARPDADDGAAGLRIRADYALRQIQGAQLAVGGRADSAAGAIDPRWHSPALFQRGAAALLGVVSARHSPREFALATREAERTLGARRLAMDLCRSLVDGGGTPLSAVPEERSALVRRLADATGIAERRASEILEQNCELDATARAKARASLDDAAQALAGLRAGLAKQESMLAEGLAESAGELAEAASSAEARAAGTVESAIAEARKLTPELLKTVDALERLGVIGEDQAGLKNGIARFDGALAMIEGGLAFAAGNPTGLFQVIQGLANLVAPEVEKEDGTIAALDRLEARNGEAGRKLDRIRVTIDRIRQDMALAFRRQEREAERLRQTLSTLIADASFQDFESCVLVEDVLNSGARLQVAAAGADEVVVQLGGDWPQRLRKLGGEPPDAPADRPPVLLRDCLRSMLRLFGTDQTSSVSKPFLVPDASEAAQPSARRHDLFVRTLLAESSGADGRSISPHGLLDYVEAVRWVDHPLEAAWLWRRAVAGRHVGTTHHAIDRARLPQRQRIDTDRLRAVARIALYLMPVLWDDRHAPVSAAAFKSGDHPGIRVLTNLADMLDRAMLDAAITDGLAAVPPVVTLHRRLTAEYLRRHGQAASARAALQAIPAGEERLAPEANLARLEQALETARIAVLELEAVAGASDRHVRQFVDFALHRAALDPLLATKSPPGMGPTATDGLAHLRLASAWRIGLSGEAIARGSRHWRDPAGRAHDVYREILEPSAFGWQLADPAARDDLYDPAICRTPDASDPSPWLAASAYRDEVRALCDRLLARKRGGGSVAWFSGRPVEVPRIDAKAPMAEGDTIQSLRRLAAEARTLLLLAKASVVEDGSDRPLVISRP